MRNLMLAAIMGCTVISAGASNAVAETTRDMNSISGVVTGADAADSTLTVRHEVAIVDGNNRFAKTEEVKYQLQTEGKEGVSEKDLASIVLVKKAIENGQEVLKETPITLSNVKVGDKVTIDYITRNWKMVVKKVTVAR
jgi:hypothetical protein